MSLPFLETIGLTGKEASIYDFLVKNGEVPVSEIINRLKMKRATAYKSLYALVAKGLVQKYDKGKILHIKPESPQRLYELAEATLQEQQRAREDLRSYMPTMVSQYILAVEKPVISTFEGIEGLKEIYLDTLEVAKPIYAVLTTSSVDPELLTWLDTIYGPRRAKARIHASVIVASGSWAHTYERKNREQHRDTIQVPGDRFPFQHEVNVYGNKVAFMNYKKGDKLIGFIINHPQTAKTMKAWFDLAWAGAESISSHTGDTIKTHT